MTKTGSEIRATITLIFVLVMLTIHGPGCAKGCYADLKRSQAEREAADAQRSLDHWNNIVEPVRQACIKQGGIPIITDTPNTGWFDWQVTECKK